MGNSNSKARAKEEMTFELNSVRNPERPKTKEVGSKKQNSANCKPEYDITECKNKFNQRLKNLDTKKSRIISPADCGKVGDFEIIKTLGTGSFGRVVLVRIGEEMCNDHVEACNISNKFKYFSIKMMNKPKLRQLRQLEHVRNERNLMGAVDSPFVVHFYEAYQDTSYVHLRMEFVGGGEMFTHLRKFRRFNENLARFFASQVVMAFEYFGHVNILYRDLKPENIMIGLDGYIKITDLGFAKIVSDRTWTMCGTPEYLAPEIILNKGYNSTVDWWALGVLIYEMCAGFPPFYDANTMKIYEKILQCKVKLLPFFSIALKEIILGLLEPDVTRRMGSNLSADVSGSVKQHAWFTTAAGHLDWAALHRKQQKSPFSVIVKEPQDTINFDEYSEEELICAENNECDSEFANF